MRYAYTGFIQKTGWFEPYYFSNTNSLILENATSAAIVIASSVLRKKNFVFVKILPVLISLKLFMLSTKCSNL